MMRVFLLSLDAHARKLFKQLGSTTIDKLVFRSHFLFVGQKGLTAASPIEQVLLTYIHAGFL